MIVRLDRFANCEIVKIVTISEATQSYNFNNQ